MTGVKNEQHKEDGQFVFDCGSLVHIVPREEQDALAEICNTHAEYLVESCEYHIVYSVHKRRC